MTQRLSLNIVWFKRDCRIHDHAPLTEAAQHGPLLPIYIIEPAYWKLPDTSGRQWQFWQGSLLELGQRLAHLGQGLMVYQGDAVSILQQLYERFDIQGLYSHQETGNAWTYERDLRVKDWCHTHHIPWYEYPQFGVVRGLKSRDGWAAHWETFMSKPTVKAPSQLVTVLEHDSSEQLLLSFTGPLDTLQESQPPGRKAGIVRLQNFLQQHGRYYQQHMSSPISAWQSCSRLSTYLAYGCLSMREIYQQLLKRQRELRDMPGHVRPSGWLKSLNAFAARLHWHCHFIQKLESQPSIEFQNLLRAADGLREDQFNEAFFIAWRDGLTGYPFVDACMRALKHTGWMNFRMRAMLVSFASYQLWLHWPRVAHALAQYFTDYEPGIHYNQIQMQSGTTGINTIRVYNPVKQGIDQDPEGIFIKTWVPELSAVNKEHIHQPWTMDSPPTDYPSPIVDHQQAAKKAKQIIYDMKKQANTKLEARRIYAQHGSRKRHGK